jgi:hypothetical protein
MTDLVMDERGDLLADFHNILNRQKNHCCKTLTVHAIDDRQTEIRVSEPLVSRPYI